MIDIEVMSLDERGFINNHKHWEYKLGNKINVLEAIKEYIDNELPKQETRKIQIKKWIKG